MLLSQCLCESSYESDEAGGKRNQEFLVPSLSGDKAFSRFEKITFARTKKRRKANTTGEKANGWARKPANISLRADSALEQRTAKVSYRRLSAGESRGLVAAKKAKERQWRRRKKNWKNDGGGGRKELRVARKRPSDFIVARGKKRSRLRCRLSAAFGLRLQSYKALEKQEIIRKKRRNRKI